MYKGGLHYLLTNEAYTGTLVWGRTANGEQAQDTSAGCQSLETPGVQKTVRECDIKNAAGRVALLETGDWGNAGGDTKVDLKTERFGAEPPASMVELMSVASREIYAACGFNAALWGGAQAASVREAWRLALFGVLSPLGRMVESELQDKLEDTVKIGWTELRASDLSGRARAMQSMVNGGMPVADDGENRWTRQRSTWSGSRESGLPFGGAPTGSHVVVLVAFSSL